MSKMTKEELLKALKKAWQNKEEARKRTADDWANEGSPVMLCYYDKVFFITHS